MANNKMEDGKQTKSEAQGGTKKVKKEKYFNRTKQQKTRSYYIMSGNQSSIIV